MTRATRVPRGRRRAAAAALLALAMLGSGCGEGAKKAPLFRAEKIYHEARKAEDAARLGRERPDSTSLMRLRERYLAVRRAVPGPYDLTGTEEERERKAAVLKLVGAAEVQAARLAMEARRPDLALEASQRLRREASADSASDRQAAFMAVAALRSMRRHEETIEAMKNILRRFPPRPPTPEGGEDPILGMPEAIANLRRDLGDDAGVTRERQEAATYFRGLLGRPLEPALEAQVRARLVKVYLDLGQNSRAWETTRELEQLVVSTPSLHPMLPEVMFAKGKIRAALDRDPSDGIAILDRVATDYPGSPMAPRALFEAATQVEARGAFQNAKARYEAILQRFPESPEVAPMSMFRLAHVLDRLEDWRGSKRMFEALPARYPRTIAAVEAPFAVIQHYLRENQKTAAEQYLGKAIGTYRDMVVKDSLGPTAPLIRRKMVQLLSAKRDSTGLYAVTDEMVRLEPRHPYTGQMLLEAARAAEGFGNGARSVEYMRSFLRLFPQSPLAAEVRRKIREQSA